MSLRRREFDIYLKGRLDGFLEGEAVGWKRGWADCDEEISHLQREAHRVVQFMARLEPWDVAQRKRRTCQDEAAQRHAGQAQPWPQEAS
jgi:hypothetical protein